VIVDFYLLLWILGFTLPLYWVMPSHWVHGRLSLLTMVSALLITALSPLIFLSVGFYALLLWVFCWASRIGFSQKYLRRLSWFVFAPLAFIEFIPPTYWVSSIMGADAAQVPLLVGLTYLGISYTAIRCFIMIREYYAGNGPNIFEALTAFMFFGHFVAGPISGAQPWKNLAEKLVFKNLAIAFSRIFWGAALFFVIPKLLDRLDLPNRLNLADGDRARAWFDVYDGFFRLYIDFSGYSAIAIGIALLYGVRLPENFNWPLLSTSIQEFWQRWHISLGKFISVYLFNPLVRQFGKPGLAIFLAFISVGIWHKFSLTYLIWGVGHGAALALNMALRKRYPIKKRPTLASWFILPLGWIFTMSYVALLSAFANSENIKEGLLLLQELIL